MATLSLRGEFIVQRQWTDQWPTPDGLAKVVDEFVNKNPRYPEHGVSVSRSRRAIPAAHVLLGGPQLTTLSRRRDYFRSAEASEMAVNQLRDESGRHSDPGAP